MKSLTILLLSLAFVSVFGANHYGNRVLYTFRTSNVHNAVGPATDFNNGMYSVNRNDRDSIWYMKSGAKWTVHAYSSTHPNKYALTTFTQRYSREIYRNYIRISKVSGEIPLAKDFRYANEMFWNLPDQCIYEKINGVVVKTKSIYAYVVAVVIPNCVFTYSAWSECSEEGSQTRTVISQTPSNCTGDPILTQSCTYSAPAVIESAEYWIASTGVDVDNDSGDSLHPFKSLNKAYSVAAPGDLIYVRGGTYTATQTWNTKSGAAGNYIRIWAYPGESPIFDFAATTFAVLTNGIAISGANYIWLKGLRVTNMNQPTDKSLTTGITIYQSNNCIVENCETDHIGGYGVTISKSNNTLVKNCDAHHCYDPNSSTPYDGANGFGITGTSNTSSGTIFRGCRAWLTGDDGFDLYGCSYPVTFDSCWAFWNGYESDMSVVGSGNGFKLGPSTTNQTSSIRTVTNCLSFENSYSGYLCNNSGHPDGNYVSTMYNNVAYNNGTVEKGGRGFNFWASTYANVYKNNIDYDNYTAPAFGSGYTATNNTWNGGVTVSNADFSSVISTGMNGARKSDGSLPVLNFLHLVSGSDLIDSGVNVSIPFLGTAPDMGAFEKE